MRAPLRYEAKYGAIYDADGKEISCPIGDEGLALVHAFNTHHLLVMAADDVLKRPRDLEAHDRLDAAVAIAKGRPVNGMPDARGQATYLREVLENIQLATHGVRFAPPTKPRATFFIIDDTSGEA